MKKIKLKFINQWTPDDSVPKCSLVANAIQGKFDVDYNCDDPDYVISQGFHKESLSKYKDKVIIFETGEAISPDFNLYDYAIGYDDLSYHDRYFQFPYHLYQWKPSRPSKEVDFKDRSVCNFIYSNKNAHPLRDAFFHFLNSHIKIDSYGKHLNNMGNIPSRGDISWQSLKRDIQARYVFSIAFENSNHLGYTTEKICDAFDSGTIPIYFGNSRVDDYINPKSFIWVKSEADFEWALSEMKRILASEEIFHDYLNQPKLQDGIKAREKEMEAFICSIFDQDISEARRRPIGTYQDVMMGRDRKFFQMKKQLIKGSLFYSAFKKIFR